ncbi:MAG: alpha/beta fold hydrolase [Balneolaceae bacterium]
MEVTPRKSEESMRNIGKTLEITINETSVSYTDDGLQDSPAIFFLHGFPLNKSMWESQVSLLEQKFRVITYDIRGHGESEIGSDTLSIDLFSDDLVRLMDELEIKTGIICGLSMGGYIALNIIQKYPERVDALILCDTQCSADTAEIREKRMSDIDYIKKNGVKEYAEKSVKSLFMPESIDSKSKEVEFVKKMIKEMSVETLTRTLRALADRRETCNDLSRIDVPVLIMMGEKDNITPPSKGKFMQNNINHSELKIIKHAGHVSNLENADQFNEHLTKFVDSIYESTHKERSNP